MFVNDKKMSYGNKKIRNKNDEEDVTEYGEFVATFDAWMTPEEQKRRANHLANLNKKK